MQAEIVRKTLEEKGYEVIEFTSKSVPIQYKCKCGDIKRKLHKDIMNRGCKKCNNIALKEVSNNGPYTDVKGETWVPIEGGLISSFGNAKNNLGTILKLSKDKYQYFIGGKKQFAGRLVATAFKLPNYEKLDSSQKYIAAHIDGNPANNRVDNIEVRTKTGHRKNPSVEDPKKTWGMEKFLHLECRTVPEFPNYVIYENGEIFNGKRFLNFTKRENYLSIYTGQKIYQVHRIVCYAFNPIMGKTKLSDYENLFVIHKNGINTDNHASNLSWSRDKNMYDYAAKINGNGKAVIQLDKESGKFIKAFPTAVIASKETGEPEHRIRTIASGKKNSVAKFDWKYITSIDEEKKCYYVNNGDEDPECYEYTEFSDKDNMIKNITDSYVEKGYRIEKGDYETDVIVCKGRDKKAIKIVEEKEILLQRNKYISLYKDIRDNGYEVRYYVIGNNGLIYIYINDGKYDWFLHETEPIKGYIHFSIKSE